jgi:hypothetical protein
MRFDVIYNHVPPAHLIHWEANCTDISLQRCLITATIVTTEIVLTSPLLLASILPA